MGQRIYVALDLETTGLNPRRNQIIEVAAVRFQGSHILDRFSSLVNPGMPIPLEIQQLTGITDEQLSNAPGLHVVLPELRAFVDRQVAATVAHNAGFDLGFLQAAGLRFNRPSFDTFELATILLPNRSGYSLGQLCEEEEIPLVTAHRALDDAQATAQLFNKLLEYIEQLPTVVLDSIVQCGTFDQHLDRYGSHLSYAAGEQDSSSWSLLPLFQAARGVPSQKNKWNRSPNFSRSKSVNDEVLLTQSEPSGGESLENDLSFSVTPEAVTSELAYSGVGPLEQREQDAARAGAGIEQILGPEGPFAQIGGDFYEHRPGQIAMSQAILRSLQNSEHLLIEAGTGTGKSLAYLLAAALWSMQSGARVVIATNTLALQDQLLDKELPQLQSILQQLEQAKVTQSKNRRTHSEREQQEGYDVVTTGLLKGRSHYLCTRRFRQWVSGRSLSSIEMHMAAKILVWLYHTQSGDSGELLLPNHAMRSIWSHICSDATTCAPERCGTAHPGQGGATIFLPELMERNIDFYYEAKRKSEDVHLLVVNHALLWADIASHGRLLPSYQHIIIDEGHRLEEVATQQFTYKADWTQLQNQLGQLASSGSLMQALRSLLQTRAGVRFWDTSGGDPSKRYQSPGDAPSLDLSHKSEQVHEVLLSMDQRLQRIRIALKHFTERLTNFCLELSDERVDIGYAQRIHLDSGLRAQPYWSEIEIDWDRLSHQTLQLLEEGWAVSQHLEDAHWSRREPHSTRLRELQGILQQTRTFVEQVDGALLYQGSLPNGAAGGQIAWLEINNSNRVLTLQIAPTSVADRLDEALLQSKKSVIVTGATLNSADDFQHIKNQLGFHHVQCESVESPFDYEESTLLLMPQDMPSPNHSNYQSAVEQAIISAATASNGRTLALFTSNRQIRVTANAIREPLNQVDIRVLEQTSGSRRHLLQAFRANHRSVLLGTRTFWEGIDLPGNVLTTLLIVRLPFAVPNDPLFVARSAQYDDPFSSYSVPDAVLRFRQGFGRLIRRRTDRGSVVLLDSRIWQKKYGQAFLNGLPVCTISTSSLNAIAEEITAWLPNIAN
ncbi:MAG: helicase C-terminal domain-containing protein [Chloroflexota bacterium]